MYNYNKKEVFCVKEFIMEYGLIPNIDQYSDNKTLELEQVHASTATSKKASEQEQLSKIQKEEFINGAKESGEIQQINSQTTAPKFEYVLANTNFGFNDKSHDFFVKVARGNAENQYPTEDMMRLKSYMMSLSQSAS